VTTIDNLMALHDEAAEKRHINGAPVYNVMAAKAREALRTALTEALAFNPDWADFENGRECGRLEAAQPVAESAILARGRFHAFKGENGEPDDWEWFEAGTNCEHGCVDALIVRADSIQAAQPVHKPTGWMAHRDQYAVPVLFNPYTGEPRDVRDVQSDPQGILIVPTGNVEMVAASKGAQPVREPDLSSLSPKAQDQIREWLADGTFVERAIGTMREQERELSAREPLTDELTSIKEMGKHAFRALDKAASVIATIDPESNDESEELAKLTTEIHDVAMSLFTVCGLPMQEAALWFYRERAHGIGGGE
jgi:hypothetical protein